MRKTLLKSSHCTRILTLEKKYKKRYLKGKSLYLFKWFRPEQRSGRQIKRPELYQPEETVLEDDYAPEDHDSDIGSDIDTEDEYYSEDDSEDDDDEGSLKDFLVDDDEESEEEDA